MPHRFASILCLVLAGEAIFSLPFHVARFFRKPLLEVFAFSNADLGDVFAVYGVTAMLAYFPGGLIADRFSARGLLTVSLLATAGGGLYMTSIPGYRGMTVLYAYWGVTTILLFWAALIRATREWGGALSQGRAFGLLDGGRGLAAAGLASIAVVLFAHGFSATESATGERTAALVAVIRFYTAVTFATALAVWWFIPAVRHEREPGAVSAGGDVRAVLHERVVWAQAGIVVCAYCGYKGLDNVALYAVDVLGMGEAEAAGFATAGAYLRPVAAVAAGLLADRVRASRLVAGLFTVLTLSYGALAFVDATTVAWFVTANILVSFAGVYALRGVYFALLEESRIAERRTGAAVGLISLVGFTPDIFFAAIGGRLIDAHPGIVGHQHYFAFLGAIMALGICATLALLALTGKNRVRPNVS